MCREVVLISPYYLVSLCLFQIRSSSAQNNDPLGKMQAFRNCRNQTQPDQNHQTSMYCSIDKESTLGREVKGCHPTDGKPWKSLVGSVEHLTHCVVIYLFNKFQLRNIAGYSFCHFLNIPFIGFIKSTFKGLSGCWHKQIAGRRLQPRCQYQKQ